MGVTINVADRGEDYEIDVWRDNPALGVVHVRVSDSHGAAAYMPRLSAEEARELASLLNMAADAVDKG
jgi:hypothetical protein